MDPNRYPKTVIDRVRLNRAQWHAFEQIDPTTTALLVVDLQVAFMAEDSQFCVDTARDVVPTVNRLARALRDAGGRVVWVVSTYGPNEEDRWPVFFNHIVPSEFGRAFRASLTEGAPGHAIWPALEVAPADDIVSKNRFSGFVGSRGRLESLLRERGIDTVLITGTVTNVCCESTAREAAMLDFKTIMVSDGNGGRSDEDDLQTYSIFMRTFGDVMSSDEVLDAMKTKVTSAV